MPAKKKPQTNPFWLFAQRNKSKWRGQGYEVDTNKHLLDTAGIFWEKLSPQERNEWNLKAKEEKRQQKVESVSDLRRDCHGDIIAERRDPYEEAQRRRQQNVNDIKASFEGKDVSQMKFYFVNFQEMCELSEGRNQDREWLPREVALLEYSLTDGITRVYHQLIWPGEPPPGFRALCEDTSSNYHHIPVEKLPQDSDNFGEIWKDILSFISEAKPNSPPPPLFCLAHQYEMTQFFCDWLWEKSSGMFSWNQIRPVRKVYALEDLLFLLLEASGKPEAVNISMVLIHSILSGSQWDYIPKTACPFHEEVQEIKFCCLAVVKKYAFAISDSACHHYDITLTETHVPTSAIAENIVITEPDSWSIVSKRKNRDPRPNKPHGGLFYETSTRKEKSSSSAFFVNQDDGEDDMISRSDLHWQPQPEKPPLNEEPFPSLASLSISSHKDRSAGGRKSNAGDTPFGHIVPPGLQGQAMGRGGPLPQPAAASNSVWDRSTSIPPSSSTGRGQQFPSSIGEGQSPTLVGGGQPSSSIGRGKPSPASIGRGQASSECGRGVSSPHGRGFSWSSVVVGGATSADLAQATSLGRGVVPSLGGRPQSGVGRGSAEGYQKPSLHIGRGNMYASGDNWGSVGRSSMLGMAAAGVSSSPVQSVPNLDDNLLSSLAAAPVRGRGFFSADRDFMKGNRGGF